MPITRLLDNGMSYEDAVRLHADAARGVPWLECAEWLGEQNLARAHTALEQQHTASAETWFLRACAGFRFAQSALLHDTEQRRELYRKVIDSFASAAPLMSPPATKLEVPFGSGTVCGWLLRPPQVARPPVVILFGGADGWRESYYPVARFLLDRGIAACLLDGPGQGETRLFRNVFLTSDYHIAISSVITALLSDSSLAGRVGVFGNSLGGTLAAGVACRDQRISAVCVNGGSAQPIEVLERYPRFLQRFAAMTASKDPQQARQLLADLALGPCLRDLRCPLLVLHGGADQVFLLDNARRIFDSAGSVEREMLIWDDGEHCLYNHSLEKHCRVADWFTKHLN